MNRDPYFNTMQNQTNHIITNSANSFPIGTFSIEQTTSQAQSNFSQPDFFSGTQGNGMSNGINGSIGTFNANSTGSSNNNNNSTDPSQASRETGIIEKLLVSSQIHFNL